MPNPAQYKPTIPSLSFRQQLSIGFIAVIAVLAVGMSITLFKISNIEQLGIDVIDKRQPTALHALEAVRQLNRSQNDLHAFLLTGDENFYNKFVWELDSLDAIVADLNASTKAADSSTYSEALKLTKSLRTHGERLKELQSNYDENFPVIYAASQLLSSLALEYLGQVNEYILDISEIGTPSEKNQGALYLLAEMRHTWTQMMSYLRIALATRTSKDLINVRAYATENKKLFDRLKETGFDFGVGGYDTLETTRSEYLTNLEKLIGLYNSETWRLDAYLMKTEVLPVVSNLEFYLDTIAQKQVIASKQSGESLTSELFAIRYSNLLILLSGLAVAALVATAITRGLGNKVKTLSEVANKVAKGDLKARVSPLVRDELGELGARFNNMVIQLETLVNEKDGIAEELNASKEQAERASHAKSEFLSGMSHELRTPLNAILGFSEVLEKEPVVQQDLELNKMVTDIYNAGNHLLGLINEILDLPRIEAGKLDLAIENVSLNEVLHHTLPFVAAIAENKKLTIVNKLDESGDYSVRVDYIRLKQVLMNLLTNAIKYNIEHGRIEITAAPLGEKRLRIIVADTGIGIAKDGLPRIFEPFERLHSDASIEGMGMGLAVSKRLVEAMGGQLGVNSTLGVGSSFWVELEMAEVGMANKEAAYLPGPDEFIHAGNEDDPLLILYIEDNPSNLRVVEQFLKPHRDIHLIAADTPEEGLVLAERHSPDLILLDINLPGMNGYQVLKYLREEDSTREIPVIAVSANAMPDAMEQSMSAGFDYYLTKPFSLSDFNHILSSYV